MKQWYVLGADKACSNDENADGNVPVLCGALNPQQVMTIFTNVGYLLCVVSWFCTFCIRLARQSEWYNISISSFVCQCFIRCSLCPKAARWNVRNQRPTASRSAVLVILCYFFLTNQRTTDGLLHQQTLLSPVACTIRCSEKKNDTPFGRFFKVVKFCTLKNDCQIMNDLRNMFSPKCSSASASRTDCTRMWSARGRTRALGRWSGLCSMPVCKHCQIDITNGNTKFLTQITTR